jgi:hypothetical protein
MIFPSKDQRDWSKYQRPFEDGDVVSTENSAWIGITIGGTKDRSIQTYCVLKSNNKFEAYTDIKKYWAFDRLANEEEKQKLFDAIKANGYKWNAETKTLGKLIKSKFDITALVPFESKVLVRDTDHYEWEGAVFGRYDGNTFFTIGGVDWRYCIPFEDNKHLFGTTNDCDDFYKTWEE